MAKHFRAPDENQPEEAPQTPSRGNPRERYLREQAAARPEAASSAPQAAPSAGRGSEEPTQHERRTLEPLDSFPSYGAPSMDDTGSYDTPVERPLPYGGAPSKRSHRPHNPTQSGHHHSRRRRSSRRKHRWPVVVACVVLALVVAAGVCGFSLLNDAKTLKSEVSQYTSELSSLGDAVLSGDGDQAAQVSSQLVSTAETMKSQTDGPLWTLASFVPVYGSDVAQARELTETLNDLTANGIAPAVDSVKGYKIQDLIGDGGTVNLNVLNVVTTALESLKDPLQRTANVVNGMSAFHMESIESTMGGVRDTLSATDTLVQQADEVMPILPSMLGADGQTKTYLIMALNNAELQESGGFVGSSGTMTCTNGSLHLGDFTTIAGRRELSATITDEEMQVIGDGLAINPGIATATPSFPRAAQVFAQEWQYYEGGSVDGVIAMDPVFLQSLLKLTGASVTVDGVEVNGDNANEILLHYVYWHYATNDEMDAFFQQTAKEAFSAVLDHLGNADLFKLVELFQQNGADRRFQIWMRDDAQEDVIRKLGASGELSTDETAPVLGVYLGDNTWAKLQWYDNAQTVIGDGVKNADGSTTYSVTTTVTNTITQEEAATAPPYVAGSNPERRATGDMITRVTLVAPAGGSISDVTVSGGAGGLNPMTLYGFNVYRGTIQDLPQETTTITYQVTTATTATEPLTLSQTPTAQTFS